MRLKYLILVLALYLFCGQIQAQQVLMDQGIQAEGLWCFPTYPDSTRYVYMPSQARLAYEDSLPVFSYLRYVMEKPVEEGSSTSINEVDGGGLLHFVVLYDTPIQQIENAQNFLREQLDNEEVTLNPVVFDKARYALISSIVNPEDESVKTQMLSTGEAPVMEGGRMAFSFEVDPLRSKLLLESFKMGTSDLSLVFELSFSGLSDHYEAELEIDWTEVRKSEVFGGGLDIYVVSAEVEKGMHKLLRDNAINLTVKGSNSNMDKLLNVVYDKLLKLMFEPFTPEEIPQEAQAGIGDAIGGLLKGGAKEALGFGINAAYKLQDIRTEGKSELTFNGQYPVTRNHFVTFNAGNLYSKYGDNDLIFKDVQMWDPAFKQRDVFVGVDGFLEREFDQMIEGVTVFLRKKHDNGDETLKDIFINKEKFKESDGKLSMSYLNHADSSLIDWLDYEYQTIWKFTGGGSYTTEWQKESSSIINLHVPFTRREIELEGDMEILNEKNIRVTRVKIEYDFFGEKRSNSVNVRPDDLLPEKNFEITVPRNVEKVEYSITWFNKDGSRITTDGIDEYGLLFIDEFPD